MPTLGKGSHTALIRTTACFGEQFFQRLGHKGCNFGCIGIPGKELLSRAATPLDKSLTGLFGGKYGSWHEGL